MNVLEGLGGQVFKGSIVSSFVGFLPPPPMSNEPGCLTNTGCSDGPFCHHLENFRLLCSNELQIFGKGGKEQREGFLLCFSVAAPFSHRLVPFYLIERTCGPILFVICRIDLHCPTKRSSLFRTECDRMNEPFCLTIMGCSDGPSCHKFVR